MSIQPWFDVWCDIEGCAEWTTGGPNRRLAARAARAVGWIERRGVGWVCTAHPPFTRREVRP